MGSLFDVLTIAFVVMLLVFLTGLYVAAEFATVSARKTRIRQLAAGGNQLARALLPLMEDPAALDRYVAACQLGITATSLVLGAYGQSTLASRLVPLLACWGGLAEPAAASLAVAVVLIGLALLQMILSELFPKAIAVQHPERVALAMVVPMRWSLVLLRPFIAFFNGSGILLLKLLRRGRGADAGEHAHVHSPEEIELLVAQSARGGLLDTGERQLLRNVLRLPELTARQVMVPRTRVRAAPLASTTDTLLNMAIQAGFTRIPLYEGTIDNVVGFVSLKDLFRLHVAGRQEAREVLYPVIYVPERLPIVEVWRRLSNARQYLAIVLDEYGGTAGLITFEDLLEEIFGELQDEFDRERALLTRGQDGRLNLRGDLLVGDVNEYLGLALPENETDTLGGLVFSALGRLPAVGDEVTIAGTRIRVEAVAALSVAEVSLRLAPGAAEKLDQWEDFDDGA